MKNKMTKCQDVAKEIICAYLSTSATPEGLNAIYEIRSGDKKVLLKHIKALCNIFDTAIEELIEEGIEDE